MNKKIKVVILALLINNSVISNRSELSVTPNGPQQTLLVSRNMATIRQSALKLGGADVNFQYPEIENNTALMDAIKRDLNTKAIFLIAHKDSNLNIQNDNDFTALMWAALKGNLRLVKELVEHGADLDIKNKNGETALMIAVDQGHTDVARYLMEKQANIHAKNVEGQNALMEAVVQNNVAIAKQLLRLGASPETADRYNNTPLAVANRMDNTQMVNLLNSYKPVSWWQKIKIWLKNQ